MERQTDANANANGRLRQTLANDKLYEAAVHATGLGMPSSHETRPARMDVQQAIPEEE